MCTRSLFRGQKRRPCLLEFLYLHPYRWFCIPAMRKNNIWNSLLEVKKQVAYELRFLAAKCGMDNRACVAEAGAIPLLIPLLSSSDAKTQENAVTALLNLFIFPNNKKVIMEATDSIDSINMADLEAGFAKLQGEDFEYYMQTYSITLGRNSKKSSVDVDLASLGGGMKISRQHAKIFYDFDRWRFALEVLGKNGCIVEGVLYLPGHPPVKLDSQDQLQMGDKKFDFLLPCRNLLKPPANNHKKSRKGQGGNNNN